MKKIILLIAMAITALPGLASASQWNINSEKTVIDFKVTNMKLMTVKGTFNHVIGAVVYDESDITKSSVTANIEAKTVNTGNTNRDKHLITTDFLDAEKYNYIKFTTTNLVIGDDRLKIHGNLTIRGITKNVVLDAGSKSEVEKQLKDKTHCQITATTDINRNDFGVDNNNILSYGIGNNVHITLNIGLDKSK